MRKLAVFGIVGALVLVSFAACGKQAAGPGGSGAGALLNLLPKSAQGVVVVDFNRAINTQFADKAIKEDKNQAKYQQFIKESGIDPQKDISGLAVALAAPPDVTGTVAKQEAAVVVSLKYNKDLVLAMMKKDGAEIKEETYQGVVVYSGLKAEPGKPPASAAFLDASTAVAGTDGMVRQVIDVFAKKAESIQKNDALAAIIKTANKNALVWCAFAIPEEATKKLAQSNPMMASLEGMKAMTMFFDYRDKTYSFEIKVQGGEQAKNKQLADMLTGFKALGAGAAAKNPDVGELLNRIEVSSGADFVKIAAGLPEDVLERLTKSAAKKVEGMVQPQEGAKPEEPAEEPTEAPKE